ncbi:MAG: hypothetical protein JWM87_3292 [Candidatus Eremiobacteraeota bacterium]|nr:hypothetical protein [Candidatus Eremiobacteraeota bacterium]
MSRIAILIDGSNLVGSLYRARLGYPALQPWVDDLRGADDLAYARFYGAPPAREPWRHRWHAFVAANRHVDGLDFFEGYRHPSTGEEKAIDVALVADMLYGKIANHFDRLVVIGGDGDHVYALKIAATVTDLRVYLLGVPPRGLAAARILSRIVEPSELVERGICSPGAGSPVPQTHRAPPGSRTKVLILRGSGATPYRRFEY